MPARNLFDNTYKIPTYEPEMLDELRASLRISASSNAFDLEIMQIARAAQSDLLLGGIKQSKVENFNEPLIHRAIILYVKSEFGLDNPDSEKYRDRYQALKDHMMMSNDYIGPEDVLAPKVENNILFTTSFKITAETGIYNINTDVKFLQDKNSRCYARNGVPLNSLWSIKSVLEAPEYKESEIITNLSELDGLFIKSDGILYRVEQNQTYKYTVYLMVPKATVTDLQAETVYDASGIEAVVPIDEKGSLRDEVVFPVSKLSKCGGNTVVHLGNENKWFYQILHPVGFSFET